MRQPIHHQSAFYMTLRFPWFLRRVLYLIPIIAFSFVKKCDFSPWYGENYAFMNLKLRQS